MLLALSEVYFSFSTASGQRAFCGMLPVGLAKFCFAARHRRLSGNLLPASCSGIFLPAEITLRFAALRSRYGLMVAAHRRSLVPPSGSFSGMPLSQTLTIGI